MENTSAKSTQKYADTYLSEQEQEMFKFLEESYGITRDEFCSIVLWLDNFGLKFVNVDRFEQVENALSAEFGMTADDIYSVIFQHADVFCKDFSVTKENFDGLSSTFGVNKKDFVAMLKSGSVFDKEQAETLCKGLVERFPEIAIPIKSVLKNTIEFPNFDYVEDFAFKIELLKAFKIQFDDIGERFEFLKIPREELVPRLKLMHLTNELPYSFLSVGYKSPVSKAYKLFLMIDADRNIRNKLTYQELSVRKKSAEAFDDRKPLSTENLRDIDEKFAQRHPKMHNAVAELYPQKETDKYEEEKQPEQINLEKSQVEDVVECGKLISYLKDGQICLRRVKTNPSQMIKSQTFERVASEYRQVWDYMVKNFGLSESEYSEVAMTVNPGKNNRLKQSVSDIEAVYDAVSKDYQVTREQFGQFFKHTLYSLEQRLAQLECFGIIPQDLAGNDYENASILDVAYDQLEYMLKIAVLGNVDLEQNLHRIAKYHKEFFLAKFIKFVESGSEGNMLDIPMTEEEYRENILTKNTIYKSNRFVEKAYADRFPVSNAFLEGFNENQRNLMMFVGCLIKKYGMSYVDAKAVIAQSGENFNEHTRINQSKIDSLENLGFNPLNVIQNSKIMGYSQDRIMSKAILARYLGIDEDTFLKHYIATDEAKVFARMMGAMDIKPSYYYASEKIFSGLTGLSTKNLMETYKITPEQISQLKKKIFEQESKRQTESIFNMGSQSSSDIIEGNKLSVYSEEEFRLRSFLARNYGIDADTFNESRVALGSKGLHLMNVAQVEMLFIILKRDFDVSENEDIAMLFRNNPIIFSNGFDKIISKYPYLVENFDTTKGLFKKLLLRGDVSVLLRDDLSETYHKLHDKILTEFGVDITKQDFITILKNIRVNEKIDISGYVYDIFRLLKNYQVDPKEINGRYNFMMVDDLRLLETRLMIMHLLDEKPNYYFGNNCYIPPNIMIERYFLYSQGKIPRKALWKRYFEFKEMTGIELNPDKKISSLERIEIARQFTKKMKKVSFAPNLEIYNQKLKEKADDEIVIRNNDYLSYMFAMVLGVDYSIASSARHKGTRIAEVYARFMGVNKFLDDPNGYYLPEKLWQDQTCLWTLKLKEKYPLTPETAEIIKRAYFEKYPEEAFGEELKKEANTEEDLNFEEVQKIGD